jgi:hypothetical protein
MNVLVRQERERGLAALQGALYVPLGLWPIVDYASFRRAFGAAGPRGVFRLIGGTMTAIGVGLLASALVGKRRSRARSLAGRAGRVFPIADVALLATRAIGPIVLAEDAIHLALARAWSRSQAARR